MKKVLRKVRVKNRKSGRGPKREVVFSPAFDLNEAPIATVGTGVDTVALTSRWDYGADGSRLGLLKKMKEVVEAKGAEFLVLVGGLVSKRGCLNSARRIQDAEKKLQTKLKLELEKLFAELSVLEDDPDKVDKKVLAQKRLEIADKKIEIKNAKPRTIGQILDGMVEGLAEQIYGDIKSLSLTCPDGSRMKIYLVTSKAFDGDVGRKVAKRLVELQGNDTVIRYLSSRYEEDTTFKIPLKKSGRTFAVVVPTKAVWRSAYYSTNADRLLEDEVKRTTRPLCDLYAVGCGASSLNRGRGEKPFQRITIPALHKLEDVVTSENMVGVRIVRFTPDKENCPVTTVSMKDLISDEANFIVIPEKLTKLEKAIIERIKRQESTVGMLEDGLLEDGLSVSRENLEKALTRLLALNPRIIEYDDESQKYYLSQGWLQRQVEYAFPDKPLVKEVLAGCACMHAGSINTAYHFIVNILPKLLYEHEVTTFVGVGDLIQGLKHELALQGEIIPGMDDNSTQEKVAGVLISTVMLRVLSMRMERMFTATVDKKLDFSSSDVGNVEKFIRASLVDFPFWIGNHDAWSLSAGYKPLDTMESTMRETLAIGISSLLQKFGLPFIPLEGILEDKVRRMKNGTYYKLPSGLLVAGKHYYAGRTATSSTWCQRALGQFKSQIVLVANFHVEETVEEWSARFGLRVCTQIPTLMTTSAFESNKGKVTDFGIGLVEVCSVDGRIISSETNFLGVNPETSFDRSRIARSFLREFGVGEWVNLEKAIR